MNEHTIYMCDFGDNKIGARIIGVEIKDTVIRIINSNPNTRIIFDFSGIDYISTGFAKELFGELYRNYGKEFHNKISIKIPDENETIKKMIINAIKSI